MTRLPDGRIQAIDLARGTAIFLMILSHGVKGLLTFDQIPNWGLVPIHLITKFSSSLFILVFGISLALAYLPSVGTSQWQEKRKQLWIRGIVVLFWYKALTIVEMQHLYSRKEIIDALLYRSFPIYVEVLGFYAFALIWIPWVLPLWKRLPLGFQIGVPVALAYFSSTLSKSFNFWGLNILKAILVEHEEYYTWGQLSRAPLIFTGLLLGSWISKAYWTPWRRRVLITSLFVVSACQGLLFFLLPSSSPLYPALVAIARNEGKHPPELDFMLFSVSGAFFILALSLWGGNSLASLLRPLTWMGTQALRAFVFHIFVLFLFYRYLLGFWTQISYPHALVLTGLMMGLTLLWIKGLEWIQKNS